MSNVLPYGIVITVTTEKRAKFVTANDATDCTRYRFFFNESIFSTNVSLISIERVGPMIAYPESLFIKSRLLKVLFDRALGAS